MTKTLLAALGLSALFLTGCSTTITNLTPSQQPRNASGLYPFEAMIDTTQRSIREDSVHGSVLIGLESYPMQRTPMLPNRWETLVPVPPDRDFVSYRFKFDYLYNSIPEPKPGSVLSPPYQLHISDQ